MHLTTPAQEHMHLWLSYRKEFADIGEKVMPGIVRGSDDTYEAFLEKVTNHSQNRNVPPNLVPSTTYFMLNEQQDKILGVVSIRHFLNETLTNTGGHIGYGVAPSERRQGFATEMLRLALCECREMGIDKALVTCNKDNLGSAKTIHKNGGILENEYLEENGNIVQRYWICTT